MDTHSEWLHRDQDVVWHGFTQMAAYAANEPVIVDRAEGRELIDVEGRRYLDAISSLWVITLGHRVPELDQALAEQAARVAHSTLLGNGNRAVIELAEALAPLVPVETPHFLFASDGATAVEQALKIAFQYWVNRGIPGKNKFLAFADAYHGDTIGALSVGGGGFGTEVFDPMRFPVIRAPSFRDPAALPSAAEMVGEHAAELAAVIVEPLVQAASGMLIARPESFAVLRDACERHDVLLICDEVATGFGRTGTLFASQRCGLRPDILCLGKGITGGYLPMSATVAGDRVYRSFLGPDLGERTLYHGHSYGGNALAAAVATKHIELLSNRPVLANVTARSEQLRVALAARVATHRTVRDIRVVGLMGGVELDTADEPLLARRVCAAMVRRGVLSRSLGPVVTIVPPLTVTASEIDQIVDALAAALGDVAP